MEGTALGYPLFATAPLPPIQSPPLSSLGTDRQARRAARMRCSCAGADGMEGITGGLSRRTRRRADTPEPAW